MLTGIFTFNEILILQSALDPFLVSWALYALTRAMAGGGTPGRLPRAGASLGLLALNRPNALVFAVGGGRRVSSSVARTFDRRARSGSGRLGSTAQRCW